jgi:hypothetical protein
MIPQESNSEDSSIKFRWNLLQDDSVELFETTRFLCGMLITACVFLAAHIWL